MSFQLSHQVTLKLDSDDVCRLFPDGTVLRKPGTCDETIKCMDGKTTPNALTCPNQGWILTSKKCGKVSDDYCAKTNCKKNGDVWVADKKNCQGWVQCNGVTKVTQGSCPNGQVFDQKQQRCIYRTQDYVCASTFDVCNVAPQDQRFVEENNCHKFLTCNKSQKEVINLCPLGQYYVARTGQCIAKAQADCYKHPYPENVCGTTKLAIRGRFVDDEATCRGYFYCADLGSGVPDTKPHWGQCPDDMFFDDHQEVCRHRTHVKCDEDRCDGREDGLELSEKLGCQHYLVCENGYTLAEEKCPNEMYFDAYKQECVSTRTSYPACS